MISVSISATYRCIFIRFIKMHTRESNTICGSTIILLNSTKAVDMRVRICMNTLYVYRLVIKPSNRSLLHVDSLTNYFILLQR